MKNLAEIERRIVEMGRRAEVTREDILTYVWESVPSDARKNDLVTEFAWVALVTARKQEKLRCVQVQCDGLVAEMDRLRGSL